MAVAPTRHVSGTPETTYAAHTATCTFLLDSEGICRRVVDNSSSSGRNVRGAREASRAAARCIGAQYVASLDPNVPGMLAEKPRVGASMLFARTDERGRVSLVRTGSLTRFERQPTEDPFEKHPLSSMSVETSAPVIEPSPPAPRFSRQPPAASAAPAKVSDPARALKNMGPGAFLRLHAVADHDDDDLAVPAEPVTDDDELARTCEYQSQATARKAYASTTNEVDAPPVPTLRDPPVGFGDEDAIEVEDPYSEPDAATAAVMAPVRLPTPFPQAPRAGSASLGQSPPPPPARTAPLSPPPAPPRLRSERPARTTEAPRTASGVRAEPGVRRR